MNSIASNSPIVREIVFNIISYGEIENSKAKHRIDNEIVPTVSTKVHSLSRGFQESMLKTPLPLKTETVHPDLSKQQTVILEGYGRLSGLIKDPSVSTIEYVGENLPIRIMRVGHIQNTNIILSKEETDSILKYVSNRTRIPLENNVFKVAIDNLLFNAVISPVVGNRFLIKKNFQISPDYKEAFK
jgi:hypothetical protein